MHWKLVLVIKRGLFVDRIYQFPRIKSISEMNKHLDIYRSVIVLNKITVHLMCLWRKQVLYERHLLIIRELCQGPTLNNSLTIQGDRNMLQYLLYYFCYIYIGVDKFHSDTYLHSNEVSLWIGQHQPNCIQNDARLILFRWSNIRFPISTFYDRRQCMSQLRKPWRANGN